MKRLLISGAAVAAVLTVLALAACGGTASSGNSSGAMGSPSSGTTVSAEEIGDAGTVLVDSSGQALYASDEETAGGKVLCTDDACLSFWTPLTVNGGKPTGSSLPGKLGVVERPDGTRQVTYDDKLLYSFNEDKPGEVTGDGFVDAFGGQQFTWHVVHSNGSVGSSGGGGGGGTSPSPSPSPYDY
jgi:predicted lipoprotein with Yx(FWY)xxD motif